MRDLNDEQKAVIECDKKNLIVSASAGSGKTFIMIEKLIDLICEKNIPISRLLILTFTKAGAGEMKSRLENAILSKKPTKFLIEQIDDIPLCDISTIDSFCEKLIKQNINRLPVNENFKLLDENESEKLKFIAYKKAFEVLSQNAHDMTNIYFGFKRNDESIFEMLKDFQNFFDSNQDKEKLITDFFNQTETYLAKSENFVNSYIKSNLEYCKSKLEKIKKLDDKHLEYKNFLSNLCETKLGDNVYDNITKLSNVVIPRAPITKKNDSDENLTLKKASASLKDFLGELKKINDSLTLIKNIDSKEQIQSYISFYKEYEKQYNLLKEEKAILDFSDLEFFTKKLLENEDIMSNLQNKYDYIFIDEYQDTNFLQEAIIKPIAKQGKFFAVGDPKQGIYGFRNASMEIMTKDIKDFANDKNSEALFLKNNYRSCKQVLDFVNTVFVPLMREDTVGIDYKKTSMLSTPIDFKKSDLPAVEVCLLDKDEEKEVPSGIYSVKEDKLVLNDKNELEAKLIASKVEKFLTSEIYDAKAKKFRKVQNSDIAILFRNRSKVMKATVKFLQEKGFNVDADIKQNLLDDGNIRILLSLFKLILNFDDDISLASVMNSWIGNFSLDELANLKFENSDKEFFEIVKQSQDEKIISFKKKIDNFYFNYQIFGLSKALDKLFNENNFYAYINSLETKNIKKNNLAQLKAIIKSGQYENDLAGIIEFLSNVDTQTSASISSSNAITVSTIHASKGLEYPIVILGGGGENLQEAYKKQYTLSREFGLGVYLYDFESNQKAKSMQFIASKIEKKKKEFIDEIMIFYVALTRAQNHLVVTGQTKLDSINFSEDVFMCKNYIDFVANAFGENFVSNLIEQKDIKTENYEFHVVEDVVEVNENITTQKEVKFDENVKKYIDFVYPNLEISKLTFKNSVSSILNLDDQKNQEISYGENRDKAIERGNAYHHALEKIDFEKINSLEDMNIIDEILSQEEALLIDKKILFKDIQLLKQKVSGKIVKEKQFIMQPSLKEAGIADSEEKVIIQGTIDLFCMGEKLVLVDYKFTSNFNENEVKEKYKKQIELYALALEKALGQKVGEKYLLSLKNANLIKM